MAKTAISDRVRTVLETNIGFDDPEPWLGYAASHAFESVKATGLERCPDCESPKSTSCFAQYVYYSTLVRLRVCSTCALIWSDVRIDPVVIKRHFERGYKDDTYFKVTRARIFQHLLGIIDRATPRQGRVLDIGGARGDLMALLAARRPDVKPVVHDLSHDATAWAAEQFGLPTITGGTTALAERDDKYDVVVMSDVLYYEPDLGEFWSILLGLLRVGATIVLRLPNKFGLQRLGQRWFELTRGAQARRMQDEVPFYNPEHLLILRREYLRPRLRRLGFTNVRFVPSPLPATYGAAGGLLFSMARLVNRVMPDAPILTPSMVVTATWQGNPARGR